MKISGTAVLALACMPSAGAFVSTYNKSPIAVTTELNLQVDKNSWVGPAATAMAGLTLASQMAFASPLDAAPFQVDGATPIVQQVSQQQVTVISESSPMSTISGSSLQLADNVEYLDFSLPSYSGSSSSSTVNKDSSGAPSFSNPFSDFDPFASKQEDSATAPAPTPAPAPVVVPDTSAEDKAAAKKAEQESAKAAKKAEKEAAAQKKAEADAEAAAKKAEKEARLKAEKEKQRLAVERANEEKKTAPALNVETPSLPDFKAPDIKIPDFKAPDIKIPDFKVPDFKAPDVTVPEFKAPQFKTPDVKFGAPEFKAPDVKLPDVSLPKFSMPKFDMPKVETPSFTVPKTPSFEAPKAPSFSAPSFGGGSGKSEYQSLDAIDDGEPQEVRDERAKAASTAYKEADASAKQLEAKARELRSIATEKKKVAKAAKDEACKTRFGGKILCIRPFGIGY